jgi:hypothetical protein
MPAFDPTLAPPDPSAPRLDVHVVANLIEATGRQVAAELEALGDDLGHWQPGPEEWCATEVVGHLIEADRRGFGGRIRRFLAEDRPLEAGWDQRAVADERRDKERSVADVAAELLAGRADALELVRSLSPADLDRVGIHQEVGELSVSDLLHEWVFHDRNHVRQLLTIAQARTWPVMGNSRKFTEVEA